jgi:hypothetical protein
MTNDLAQLPGVAIGEVIGVAADGNPLVRVHDEDPVRALVVWSPATPAWQECTGVRVVVAFVDGDARQPVVLGVLDPPRQAAAQPEVLRIESGRALVIECGEASISLREDGRVEIRGTHVISRSSGANKIKGGSVSIN